MLCSLFLLGLCAALPVAHGVEIVRKEVSASNKETVDIDRHGHVKHLSSTFHTQRATEGLHTQLGLDATTGKRYFAVDACPEKMGATCPHQQTPRDGQDEETKSGVVCCNSTGFAQRLGPEECLTAAHGMMVNWGAADKICTDRGQRLCTFLEIYSGRGCGVGCNMDCLRTWSSTEGPCSFTADSWQQGARCNADPPNETISTDIVSLEACCSDQGVASGWKWEAAE